MKAQFITLSALVAFSVTAFWNQSRAQNEEVRAGQTVTSPNGMFTVQYTDSGGMIPGVDGMVIKNNQTGRTYPPIETSIAVPIQWTGDSQTIVTIGPIAGGSVAGVLRLEGNEWKEYSADPRMGDAYKVIRAVAKYHTVDFTYVVRETQGDDLPAHFYVYSFTFHPDTAHHANERKTEIDGDTSDRLRHTFSTK